MHLLWRLCHRRPSRGCLLSSLERSKSNKTLLLSLITCQQQHRHFSLPWRQRALSRQQARQPSRVTRVRTTSRSRTAGAWIQQGELIIMHFHVHVGLACTDQIAMQASDLEKSAAHMLTTGIQVIEADIKRNNGLCLAYALQISSGIWT